MTCQKEIARSPAAPGENAGGREGRRNGRVMLWRRIVLHEKMAESKLAVISCVPVSTIMFGPSLIVIGE